MTPGDIASTKVAIKENPPVSSSKQKKIEKQEKMFYALDKDVGFQKSIAGMNRVDKVTVIQKKYADNGVKIARKKVNQMIRNGITVAKQPPIVIPKVPIVVPTAPKPPIIIPKPPPKIVSIPKEPVPKIAPPKPVPKEFLTEFKPAKTLEEAFGEARRFISEDISQSSFIKGLPEKKRLQVVNRINAQMHSMDRWSQGRKLGKLNFKDGGHSWSGEAGVGKKMGSNYVTLNHRYSFDKYGYGEKGVGKMMPQRFALGPGSSTVTLRHEMGHALWFDADTNLRQKFKDIYRGAQKTLIKKNISEYASTNHREFFSEVFTMYSSPQYKVGSLNKVFGGGFEELMEKILVGGT